MKRVVQTLIFAALVIWLVLPSVSNAGKIARSGMMKQKALTEGNAPVQQTEGFTEVKAVPVSGWRLVIGSLFSTLRFPGITIVVVPPDTMDSDEPFRLQNPPWEKPPSAEVPDGDDHGWGDN